MGFGHLLQLRVKGIPSKLAYWVIDHFDSDKSDFELMLEHKVKVTEEDIFRIYGFLRVLEKIETLRSSANSKLMDEWIASFNVDDKEKIKIKLVIAKMLNEIDGGIWFRRNFRLVMSFCLIESGSNGMVPPYILQVLDDVTMVSRLNWCEYTLRALI
ncbi:uncharacterized protein LOC130994717 [Salvia miltiorrhiza]|uniref:uncharacterized protein LOC130994717 n=1 Tax=Salvia miltiorrhiza TaxID=226208 RepID=UPI0025AC9EF4|nr:uncharacterized protein LOC130994717 [Salvia miltiorrhiza]